MRYTREQKAKIASHRHQRRYRYDMFGNVTAIVYFCKECGRVRSLDDLEVDHIIPLSLSGPDTLDNQQLLCSTCNRKKGSAIKIKGKLIRIKPRTVKREVSTSKKSTTKRKAGAVKEKTNTVRRKASAAKRKSSTVKRRKQK